MSKNRLPEEQGTVARTAARVGAKVAIKTIHEKFDELNRAQENRHAENKERFDRIEVQTLKTNGRVTSLEKFQYIMMGLGIAVTLFNCSLIFRLI